MTFFIKQTVKIIPAVIIMTSTAMAQQKPSLQNALSASYKTVVTVKDKQNNTELKKATDKISPVIQQAVEDMSVATKTALARSAEESDRANKEILKVYPVKKTAIDLIADLSHAPAPITALPAAGKTDVDAMYKSYYEMMEQRKKQLTEIGKKNDRHKEIHDKEGNAGLEKRAAAEADKSDLVREMGGAEKLKNMTDAERKQAAEQMKAKLQQNPAMLTGNSNADPGIKTIQQKLMSDPDYVKRFSSMSEAEKQAEMKKYMTIKPQEGTANRTYVKSQEQNDLAKSQEVNELLERTRKRIEAATTINSQMTANATELIDDMKEQLRKWLGTTTQAIPMVELGEYGHDRDPELVNAMEITRKYAVYSISKKEMELRVTCWNQYKTAIAAALQEFNNYADNYKWGQVNDSQLFNGTYNDPKIINAWAGFYDLVLDVAKSSDNITSNAKSAHKIFEGLL